MGLQLLDLSVGWDRPLFAPATAGFPAGGKIALLGENGSGKSTLLACIAGRMAPMSGTLRVCGRTPHGLPAPERARLVSVLLSRQPPPGALRVHELLRLNPGATGRARGEEAAAAREEAVLGALGLSGMPGLRLSELSDGQRQRAFIARSILQPSPVLIADEPLLHLDARSSGAVMSAFTRESRDAGRTVLCSLHNLDVAIAWADYLVLIAAGRLLTIDVEALSRDGSASRVFRDALGSAGFAGFEPAPPGPPDRTRDPQIRR